VAPLEMKEGTPLGARAQSAIQRAAVLYKPRLATFNFNLTYAETIPSDCQYVQTQAQQMRQS
jgi:hypothetical protein